MVRSGVTAFVRLKAALYAREDANGEFVRRLVGDVPGLVAAPAAPSDPSATSDPSTPTAPTAPSAS